MALHDIKQLDFNEVDWRSVTNGWNRTELEYVKRVCCEKIEALGGEKLGFA